MVCGTSAVHSNAAHTDLCCILFPGESGDQELIMRGVLAVVSSVGGTVDQWDLHVGATLGIMGRPVALMKVRA